MIAHANTTVAIYRGETVDEFQDPQPADVPVRIGIPASITEKTKRVFSYDDPAPRVVKYWVCRMTANVDIQTNDIIVDERSGARYMMDSTTDVSNPMYSSDMRLDLRRVALT